MYNFCIICICSSIVVGCWYFHRIHLITSSKLTCHKKVTITPDKRQAIMFEFDYHDTSLPHGNFKGAQICLILYRYQEVINVSWQSTSQAIYLSDNFVGQFRRWRSSVARFKKKLDTFHLKVWVTWNWSIVQQFFWQLFTKEFCSWRCVEAGQRNIINRCVHTILYPIKVQCGRNTNNPKFGPN